MSSNIQNAPRSPSFASLSIHTYSITTVYDNRTLRTITSRRYTSQYTQLVYFQGYSCVDLLNAGMKDSGVYYLQIRGTTYWFLKVYCEQEVAEGGWTVSTWKNICVLCALCSQKLRVSVYAKYLQLLNFLIHLCLVKDCISEVSEALRPIPPF